MRLFQEETEQSFDINAQQSNIPVTRINQKLEN